MKKKKIACVNIELELEAKKKKRKVNSKIFPFHIRRKVPIQT